MKITTNWASVLFAKARSFYKNEGLIPLLRRGFTFLTNYCLNRLFWYRTYHLFEYVLENIDSLNEADFMPRIDEFTLKIVSTSEEADEMRADGVDFRFWPLNYRDGLDKGAIAFCVFVGGELANIGWIYMTEKAKECMEQSRHKVDFQNGEVCEGGLVTNPKYRGMGLATYIYFKRNQFCRDTGKTIVRSAVVTDNIAPHRMMAKFDTKIYAEGRQLRVLWWHSWKEKPLDNRSSL